MDDGSARKAARIGARAGGVLTRLRDLLARGATFRQAAGELGVAHVTLFRWARRHKLTHRRAGLPRSVEREIAARLRRGDSVRRTARELGISSRTVHLRRLRELVRLASGPLPCAEWRCPACGAKLNINRCLADGTRKPARATRSMKRNK